jgi:hypothetical protein
LFAKQQRPWRTAGPALLCFGFSTSFLVWPQGASDYYHQQKPSQSSAIIDLFWLKSLKDFDSQGWCQNENRGEVVDCVGRSQANAVVADTSPGFLALDPSRVE